VVRDATARFLRRARLTERVLSRVRLTTDLPLVDLRGAAGLGRVGQDAWPSACDEEDYPITQQWAAALRRWTPGAASLAWMSKRDNLHEVVVLFSDRIPAGAITGSGNAVMGSDSSPKTARVSRRPPRPSTRARAW